MSINSAQRVKVACKLCNLRRVKCDRTARSPCTNCTMNEQTCEPIDSKRGRYERTSSRRNNHARTRRHSGSVEPRSQLSHIMPLPQSTENDVSGALEAPPPQRLSITTPSVDDPHTAVSEGSDMLFARLVDSPPSPHDMPHRRDNKIIYLGESYNLSYVIRHLSSVRQNATEHNPRAKQLHYFIPENIEMHARNVPRDLSFEMEEMESLRRNGALSRPPKAFSDELVKVFFQWIYPVFPIFDRAEFLASYETGNVSLLVLHAIFFAGATHCEIPVLQSAGFQTRNSARLAYYRRAKALFDADYELDPVATVQALCLLTFWCGGPLDQKDTWHWLGVVVGLAQSLGMHRSMQFSNVENCHKRLWKRIWWSIYIRDVHAAAALGRPPHINSSFCDVELLHEDDFQEYGQLSGTLVGQSDATTVTYVLHASKLAIHMSEILSHKFSPSSDKSTQSKSQDLTDRMNFWLDSLPPSMSGLREETEPCRFWTTILHITYHNYLILLYRVTDTSNTEIQQQTLAINSATKISRLLEDLICMNLLRVAPISIISSLFAALTVFVREILDCAASTHLQPEILEFRIRLCMLGLEKLQDNWPVAAWTLQLWEKVLEQLRNHQSLSKRVADGNGTGADTTHVSEWQQQGEPELNTVEAQGSLQNIGVGMLEAGMQLNDVITPPSSYPLFEDTDFLSTLFADDLLNKF